MNNTIKYKQTYVCYKIKQMTKNSWSIHKSKHNSYYSSPSNGERTKSEQRQKEKENI